MIKIKPLVTVFSKKECPYCEKLIIFLDKVNIPYIKLILDKDFSRDQFYKLTQPKATFPQVFVAGTSYGGYSEFINNAELLKNWID